jgi:hypothetical protein
VNLSVKHTKPLQLIFAGLVFLASSGATAVIRECSMETCSCCNTASCDNDDVCSQTAPAASSAHSIKAEFTCHMTTLVGGLAIQQAVVEQAHKQQLNKAVAGCAISSHCTLSARSYHASSAQLLTYAVSSPAVEKYVLNSAYLI